ncbi:Protein of unknown function [Chryseobacterium sp. RU37D]|uniref:DUF2752 domain-containing protein n=1 Tax=Chryseobacterium sp. RU37D TaxID=1907397 RepID=UPI0009556C6E|nr:DUF2752 domain-containing protein [Chryseobacterium sp. RU37D]SIQ74462.1 Protein of unknown function [Chryseobacterium sp. RU37D]
MRAEDFMLPCPVKKIFGIECLGCGSQRAIIMVFEGRFIEAFQLFPAVYTLLLFFVVLILNFIDKKRNYGTFLTFLAAVNFVVMLISYFHKHYVL